MRAFGIGAMLVIASTGVAAAQDADGDGVLDANDVAPCDPSVVAEAFAPAAEAAGVLLFEDQFPFASDLDFNDLVMSYGFRAELDAQGRALRLTARFRALAAGAANDNGFGIGLPLPRTALRSATLRVGSTSRVLSPRPDANLVFTVVQRVRDLFAPGDALINTVPAAPLRSSPELELVLELEPVMLSLAEAPFDPFIFRTDTPALEVHLPRSCGTESFDPAYFGIADGIDGSTPPHRCFVTRTGLPFALDLPATAPYPIEAVQISDLFPDILGFASSGGASSQDFYLRPQLGVAVGDRLDPFVFSLQAPDRSCISVGADIWLVASDLSTSGPVERWTSREGGNVAVQAAASLQPHTAVSAALGGQPVVRFDGSDRLDLLTHTFAPNTGDRTVVVVYRADSPNAHILGTGSSSGGFITTFGSGVGLYAGGVFAKENHGGSGHFLYGATPAHGAAGHVMSAVLTSTSVAIRLDAKPEGTASTSANAYPYTRSTIGSSDGSTRGAARDPFQGDIAEIRVYPAALTEAQILAVEQELAATYALSLHHGCDGVLGSETRFDMCGVCGGDNSTCPVGHVLQPELASWLRAQDLASLGQSSPVGTWVDASSRGVNATQSSASQRPVYDRGAFGGQGGVVFDGVNDRLDLAANLFGRDALPATVFMVLESDDASGHLIGTGSSSSGYLRSYGAGLVMDGGTLVAKYVSGGSGIYQGAANPWGARRPRLVSAVIASGATELYIDCALEAASSQVGYAYPYGRSTLGASGGSGGGSAPEPLAATVGEVIVYDAVLGAGTREAIEDYLAGKYGLSCAR